MRFFGIGLVLVGMLFGANQVSAQNNSRISGTVVDRSNQLPIAGATISIVGLGKSVVTDSSGNFRMTNLAPGPVTVTASAIGFETQRVANLAISNGNESTLTFELARQVGQLQAVEVSTRKNTARAATLESPLSIQRLTTEDIKANPGGNFDISRVIQSLPGVGGGAAGGSFRNDIIIRGGAPSENVFYLDGIEVPVINHFSTQGSGGGPQGILNLSFIEDVKLSSSAFDARYDNVLSSVFQFKQKNGNSNKLQGNFRLSGTEAALTFDGPLSKKTTFLASARRSYLGLLFQAIDLPIRPNYWDFQFKTTTRIDKKTTLTVLGIAAIDEFRFAAPKEATPEKLYAINSNPLINQWTYTVGASLRRSVNNGFWNLAISRNTLNNRADKYLDNDNPSPASRTFRIESEETENKLRFDVTKKKGDWNWSYGASAQWIDIQNNVFQIVRPALTDAGGNVIQQPVTVNVDTRDDFLRYGAFAQVGKRFFDNRLGVSAGVRMDANTLSNSESNPLKQLSPRISATYVLADKINLNASIGRYYRLPSYTQLVYRDAGGARNPGKYIVSDHYVAGLEYLPSNATRFTLEGFYKRYSNYPVSVLDGISLANKGLEFGAIGNELLQQNGRGEAYGFEFFAQQKLTNKFFGIFSYTLFWSKFSGLDGRLVPASWDNRHLISVTAGYKLPRNWELGLKFRVQGEAPFTPFDLAASRLNFVTLGTGVFDFSRVNSQRLRTFHGADLRIDKKWNFRKLLLDFFIDIQNVYGSKVAGIPQYTFRRTDDNTGFLTTDGQPLQTNGSNGIPTILSNLEGTVLPTIGFIVEF